MSRSDAIVMHTELIDLELSQLKIPKTGSFVSKWAIT